MLNERQKILYELLNCDKIFTTRDLMELMPVYGSYDYSKSDNYNSTLIRTDLLTINESCETSVILCYKIEDGNYYFYGAKEFADAKELSQLYFDKAIKALARYSLIMKKAKLNNQCLLDINNEEDNAKFYVKSFVEKGAMLDQVKMLLEDD